MVGATARETFMTACRRGATWRMIRGSLTVGVALLLTSCQHAGRSQDRGLARQYREANGGTCPARGMESVWFPDLELWIGKCKPADPVCAECVSCDTAVGQRRDQETASVDRDAGGHQENQLTERERKAGRLAEGFHYRLPTEEEFLVYGRHCGDNREYRLCNAWISSQVPASAARDSDQTEEARTGEGLGNADSGCGTPGDIWVVCAEKEALKPPGKRSWRTGLAVLGHVLADSMSAVLMSLASAL